jgi:hypothetical protein
MPDPGSLEESMPDPDLSGGVDGGGTDTYTIPDYYYEVPDYDFGLYYGNDEYAVQDEVKEEEEEEEADNDLNMYWDEIKTTTTAQPPDLYDYLFSFDIPNRNRIRVPTRKKFDAQALKLAYTEMLKNANEIKSKRKRRLKRHIDVIGAFSKLFYSSNTNQKTVSEETITSRQNDVALWVQDKVVNEIGGNIYSVINETIIVPRDRLNIYRGRPLSKVVGLLLRTPPTLFRTSFVKITLGTFNIVSTGTLGKHIPFFKLYKILMRYVWKRSAS